MKLSNEIKFGVFAVVAVAAFIIGMSYLKGSSLFGSSITLEALYDDVEGLIPGNPVTIKGVKVGRVDGLTLEGDSVLVSFTLDPARNIPVDSRAEVYSASILGEMAIRIVPGKQNTYLENNTRIPSSIEPGMIEDITSRVTDSEMVDNLTKLSGELQALAKKLNQSLGGGENEPSRLDGIVRNLEKTTDRTEQLMLTLTRTAESFSKLAENSNQVIEEVAREKGGLGESVQNLKVLTDSLAAASGDLKSLATGANATINELGEVISKVNSPNGTLGKLINDESLYKSIDDVAKQANRLIESIQDKPGRYRRLFDVDVSVFPQRDKRSKEVRTLQNEYDALLLEQAIDSLEDKQR